ncbi:MAG TPA: class I SAM-dependent methyltransferase [Pyrinomonadaceae bacterium]|jgi:ubiquinone/menaquinone biosynthesis C-methylase UbiE|nr:class I SAM-dependent methyltransferase [Pyrinomonadaceae bacterium]
MPEEFERADGLDETLEAVYERIWTMHDGEAFRVLDESLGPRPPEMLLKFVEDFDLPAGATALDVGCGRGNHTCRLAWQFGFRVAGVDPFESNVRAARREIEGARLAHLVEIVEGRIESLPFADESFDLVWCRDMLVHVPDIEQALKECARVLKKQGRALVMTTHATDLLAPGEAERAFAAVGVIAENLSPARVEAAFASAKLKITASEYIGGELLEFYEERDRRSTRELMRLARMTRAREKFVAELGRETFEIAQALYRWTLYHLLGKIGANVYTLKKLS